MSKQYKNGLSTLIYIKLRSYLNSIKQLFLPPPCNTLSSFFNYRLSLGKEVQQWINETNVTEGLTGEEIEECWIFPLKFVPVERKEDAENEEINKL